MNGLRQRIGLFFWGLILIVSLLTPVYAESMYDITVHWKTIETPHFYIHFPEKLTPLGKWTSVFVEQMREKLDQDFKIELKMKTHIRFMDNTDRANGFAIVFPQDEISIVIPQPNLEEDLGSYRNWIEELLVHEMTHIYTLATTSGFYSFMDSVFGRVTPALGTSLLIAPPNHSLPDWFLEGLAVYEETRHTPLGRLKSSEFEMYYRVAVLTGQIPSISDLHKESIIWPRGNSIYVWGGIAIQYLAHKYGDEVLWGLVEKFGGRPPFTYNLFNSSEFGRDDFVSNYYEMVASLQKEQKEKIEKIKKAAPLTSYIQLTNNEGNGKSDFVFHGDSFLYFRSNAKEDRKLVGQDQNGDVSPILNLDNLADTHLSRHKTSLYFAEIDRVNNQSYQSIKILNLESREQRTLFERKRYRHPSISPDGKSLVFVSLGEGVQNVLFYDLGSKTVKNLTHNKSLFDSYYNPRFAPDNKSIIYAARKDEKLTLSLYQFDLETQKERVLPFSGNCSFPSYSPDGRAILFISDRTGIHNIYAYDVKQDKVYQISHLMEGAFFPHVDVSNRWIYFTVYGSNGYNIARMRYQPHRWFKPISLKIKPRMAMSVDSTSAGVDLAEVEKELEQSDNILVQPYEALNYLFPTGWFPFFVLGESGYNKQFYGFTIAGEDPLKRHNYLISFAPIKIGDYKESFWHRPIYEADYIYSAHFPEISFSLSGDTVKYRGYFIEGNEGVEFDVLNQASPDWNYWTYTQVFNSTISWEFDRNTYSTGVFARVGLQVIKPDEIMGNSKKFANSQEAIYRGHVVSLAIGGIYDTSFGYRTPISVEPYSGINFNTVIKVQKTILDPEEAAKLDGSHELMYSWINELTLYFPLYPPYSTLKLNNKFGSLLKYSPTEAERKVYGEFLSIGGVDGLFAVRGQPFGVIQGLHAYVGSLQIDQMLHPIFKNFGGWYLFSRHLTGHGFMDFGSAWNKKPELTKIVSSIGVEVRYNLVVLKYFPMGWGAAYMRSLNRDQDFYYLVVGNNYSPIN